MSTQINFQNSKDHTKEKLEVLVREIYNDKSYKTNCIYGEVRTNNKGISKTMLYEQFA